MRKVKVGFMLVQHRTCKAMNLFDAWSCTSVRDNCSMHVTAATDEHIHRST